MYVCVSAFMGAGEIGAAKSCIDPYQSGYI